MRIGINLLFLLPGMVGGTETYAAGLLYGLAKISSDEEFFVFVNREAAEWPLPHQPNFRRVVCPIQGINRAKRYYYEQVKFPKLLRDQKIDLVHSLGYVGPIKTACPSVVTIPDVNFVDVARNIPIQRRLILRFFSLRAAKAAKHVITISAFSKKRLCKELKIPDDKISVTHLAPYPETLDALTKNWSELRLQYGIREPYIAAFGGGVVHKNIKSLICAFTQIKERFSHSLLLIGHLPPDVDQTLLAGPKNRDTRILTTGYVRREHISALLGHADLFVLPSLYEGFGLPVLEAQQAGVAVACSTAGSLPEVAGDGALFFNPLSVDEIAKAMEKILSDQEFKAVLLERGIQNKKKFSWEYAARGTRDVYYRALMNKMDS
jgi:glycosyltransferase involved in cell wall biosynthesis